MQLFSLLKFNPSNSNLTLRAAKHPDAVGLNLPGMALCTWCWEGQAGLGHSPVSFWREREQQIVPNASIIAFLGWRAPAPWGCARKAGRGTEPESELCSRLSKNSCWHAAPAQHCWLHSLGCTPSWASAPYWLWDGSAHHQGLGASLGWLCCSPRASRALCQPGVSDGSCGTSPGGCRSIWAVCKQQPQPPPKKDFFTASQPWCGGGESKTPRRRAVGQTEPHGSQVPCSTSPYGWESLNGCGGQGPCVPLLPNRCSGSAGSTALGRRSSQHLSGEPGRFRCALYGCAAAAPRSRPLKASASGHRALVAQDHPRDRAQLSRQKCSCKQTRGHPREESGRDNSRV